MRRLVPGETQYIAPGADVTAKIEAVRATPVWFDAKPVFAAWAL